jgi:hypothetical protein
MSPSLHFIASKDRNMLNERAMAPASLETVEAELNRKKRGAAATLPGAEGLVSEGIQWSDFRILMNDSSDFRLGVIPGLARLDEGPLRKRS